MTYRNLEDVGERIFWRSASAADPMKAFHQVLEDAAALYVSRHPGDTESAEVFRAFVSSKIAGAARRVRARYDTFAGLQIGGSA